MPEGRRADRAQEAAVGGRLAVQLWRWAMTSAVKSIAPIKQGLVKALRAHSALKAGISNEIHEAIAVEGTPYPHLIYQFVYSPYTYTWGSVMIRAGVDVWIYSRDQVEAHNLDQLVIEALEDVVLDLGGSGQVSLYSHRTADLSSAFLDGQGTKVYQVGGTFELWTDQLLA